MPAFAPATLGVIEIDPAPARRERFFPHDECPGCADDLVRLARANAGDDRRFDPPAEETLLVDRVQLAADLQAEYAALLAIIAGAAE